VTPVGDARPRPTDIRLIAATHQPLTELMRAGQFRQDLFFRLSVFQIEVPPLRTRRDDVPGLAAHFLARCRTAAEITPEAMESLCSRPWPGNVRELRNAIEHAAVVSRGQPIRPEHLPPIRHRLDDEPAPTSSGEILEQYAAWTEREVARTDAGPLYERFLEFAEPPFLRAVLDRHRGNRAAAAQVLGIHRATLRLKLRKYGID
jgi:DNA-binding NtrC family response regulator